MSETPAREDGRAAAPRRPRARLLLGIGIAVALVALAIWAGERVDTFRAWIEGFGALGPAVFVLAYAVGVMAFLPGAALTLAGGAIFGVVEGTLYVFVAATLGAAGAFLVARYLARAAVERRVAGSPRFAAIDRAIGEQGLKITFLLRLSPVFPFVILNYALGLTRVRFVDYLLACLGMIPGTLLYVYTGSLAADAASAAGGGAGAGGWGATALRVVGLAATALVTVLVTRIARRALREAGAEAPEAQEA